MRKIAIYGKGGIGKSTVTANLSAALSLLGYQVMQIGCDPKADSTLNLTNGKKIIPVLDFLREHGTCSSLDQIVHQGFNGILCVEAGGPTPGLGCAGRGIITTFEVLEDLGAYEVFKPDFVFFDVLGDVVCGGFAMPMREGYAEEVLIVTSGEKMSLYAAKNIFQAIENFADRNYARLEGLILNSREVENEEQIVRQFTQQIHSEILGIVPRSQDIIRFEQEGKTVVAANPKLPISQCFFNLARRIDNLIRKEKLNEVTPG